MKLYQVHMQPSLLDQSFNQLMGMRLSFLQWHFAPSTSAGWVVNFTQCVRACLSTTGMVIATLNFTAAPFVLLFQFPPCEFFFGFLRAHSVSTCGIAKSEHVRSELFYAAVDILWCAHMHTQQAAACLDEMSGSASVCDCRHGVFISLFMHSTLFGSSNLDDPHPHS